MVPSGILQDLGGITETVKEIIGRLVEHGRERHAPVDGQLLRYADGRPITHRRHDHLWTRIGRHLPWVATQGISTHWIRHIFLTWVEMSRIASDASFGRSREYALPAVQRAALRYPRPAGAPNARTRPPISQLEQALSGAQEALARRTEELEAARQINRELMALLNREG